MASGKLDAKHVYGKPCNCTSFTYILFVNKGISDKNCIIDVCLLHRISVQSWQSVRHALPKLPEIPYRSKSVSKRHHSLNELEDVTVMEHNA